MIAHISIGVRDIDRSKRFYDAVLEPLGYKCLRAARSLMGYGYGRDSIALWVVQAEHPVRADEKSGLHFCFTAANAAAVDAFHAAALRSGGQDNGEPGLRPIYGPHLIRRLQHRSGRISDRGILRSRGDVRDFAAV
jgi:catechol 2,3-dioxygenase-like lactoylglutathione lyase family enzyme